MKEKINKAKNKSLEEKVYNMIQYDSYITGSQIAKRLGIDGPKVRSIIHNLRLKGAPIISKGYGYCLTKNKDDIEENIESLKVRASKIVSVIIALKKTANSLDEDDAA